MRATFFSILGVAAACLLVGTCFAATSPPYAPIVWTSNQSGFTSVVSVPGHVLATNQALAGGGSGINASNGDVLYNLMLPFNSDGTAWSLCQAAPSVGFLLAPAANNYGGAVFAFNLTSGVTLWSFAVEMVFTTDVSVTCGSDDSVVVIMIPQQYYAVDVHSGKLLWTRYNGLVSFSPDFAAVAQTAPFFVFAGERNTYAKELRSGKEHVLIHGSSSAPVAIAGNIVLVSTYLNVSGYTLKGELAWTWPVYWRSVLGNVVIASPTAGSPALVGIDGVSGKQLWLSPNVTGTLGSAYYTFYSCTTPGYCSTDVIVLCAQETVCMGIWAKNGSTAWVKDNTSLANTPYVFADTYITYVNSNLGSQSEVVKITDGSSRLLQQAWLGGTMAVTKDYVLSIDENSNIVAIDRW